ncbi:MAG: asparagine synthase (glutamine-hydrolyzing) [Oligoflexales bacterium]
MCGISGILFDPNKGRDIRSMTDALYHRGPNSWGIWKDDSFGLAFGHRRLSIIDITNSGSQPMHSESERFVIAYNGEVFNFRELRSRLLSKGFKFKGNSDTEVVVNAIEEWGIKKALHFFDGQFAFAIWDKLLKKLYLAKDRFGEKPLYYGWANGTFIFASELKSLKKYSQFSTELSPEAIIDFLRYSYVPSPMSIYKHVFKLPPGSWLELDLEKKISISRYWHCDEAVKNKERFEGNYSEAVKALQELMEESISSRCISDVPIGSFLSGGIDSSLITSIMQKHSSRPIKTYTVGFKNNLYNEATYAKKIADYLGTDHSELYLSENQIRNIAANLCNTYDEPFADSSQIPMRFVCELASKEVVVCLSGDGGDEIFGGYNRHIYTEKYHNMIANLPVFASRSFSKIIRSLKEDTWQNIYDYLYWLLPRNLQISYAGRKITKLGDLLKNRKDIDNIYKQHCSIINNPEDFLISSSFNTADKNILHEDLRISEQIMLWDTQNYLPDDILCKVDRASMAVSLETRTPFLSKKIYEFSWKLPVNFKINKSQGKRILHSLLEQYLPASFFQRPKSGFSVPLDIWLRTTLFDWASDLLSTSNLNKSGIFDTKKIADVWNRHQSGLENNAYILWNILMLQSWINNNY